MLANQSRTSVLMDMYSCHVGPSLQAKASRFGHCSRTLQASRSTASVQQQQQQQQLLNQQQQLLEQQQQDQQHQASEAVQLVTRGSICQPLQYDPGHRLLCALAAALVALPALLLTVTAGAADAKLPPLQDPASNVGYLTNKEVDKKRKKANFVRAYDGHVSIQNKYTKAWTDLKCDLQVPGLLLLRDASGEVFYLGYGGLKQIDLSDDQVVAAIATDDWENNITPVEGPGETGAIERLEMTREGFYQLVSLTSGEDFEAEAQEQPSSKK